MARLLRQPDFLKLWTGQTISEMGSRVSREGIPMTAVTLLQASPSAMALLAAASVITALACGPLAGVLADRMRRRPIMIAADLARAAALGIIPLAAWRGWLTYELLLAIALTSGVFTVLFDVAYQSYLPSLVGRDHILEGNQRLALTAAIAEITGPGLTGVLIQFFSAPRAILWDAVSFLVSAGSLMLIRHPEPLPRPEPHESLFAEVSAGGRFIAAHPVLRHIALRHGTTGVTIGILHALYVLYALRVLRLRPLELGLAIATGGIGYWIGSSLARRIADRIGLGLTLTLGSWIGGLSLFFVPLGTVLPALPCLMAQQLFGDAAVGAYFTHELSLRQRLAPPEMLGRVNAAMTMVARGFLPVGALFGGLIATAFGMTPAILVSAAGVTLASLWLAKVDWSSI